MQNNMKVGGLNSIADIDELMSSIVLDTPPAIGLSHTSLALEVQTILDEQYGADSSSVRILLNFNKLTDMARAHLRRNFDPEKTGEQEQLAFTQFGDDIQVRYPIKIDGKVEYLSPMYAPIDQLLHIADRDIEVGNTRIRRGQALHAFIAEYR